MYILVINVSAACDGGCTASVGLLVTKEMKRKRKGGSKRGQQTEKDPVDGDTGNYKGDVCVVDSEYGSINYMLKDLACPL